MGEKFKLEFTLPELNVILKACRKLPYEESSMVIKSIHDQYELIQREKELAAKKVKEEEKEIKEEASKKE